MPRVSSISKEPQVLNDLVGWRHRGGNPAAIVAILKDSLQLLARPFAGDPVVVVKPSNVINGLAATMLDLRPQSHGLFLYAPMAEFVTSIARKGLWGRRWVRDLMAKQLLDGLIALGFEGADYIRLTDLQAAAVTWVAQFQLFNRMAEAHPSRVRMLESGDLIADPIRATSAMRKWLGLAGEVPGFEQHVAARCGFDSKTGAAFGSGQRTTERDRGLSLYGDEIEKVVVWATDVADRAGVSLVPAALLMGVRPDS